MNLVLLGPCTLWWIVPSCTSVFNEVSGRWNGRFPRSKVARE